MVQHFPSHTHSEDTDLSSGTAAWMEIWEFNTRTANTCTSVAGESVRHESESLLCVRGWCVCAPVCSWHPYKRLSPAS